MVLIRFSDGNEWFKANWVFRQLGADLAARFAGDLDLKTLIERAEAFGTLDLGSSESGLAARATKALLEVATATLRGEIQGWKGTKPEDEDGQRLYLSALGELCELIQVGR